MLGEGEGGEVKGEGREERAVVAETMEVGSR